MKIDDNGVIREMTEEEILELKNMPEPAEPTKEELQAQLQAIQEQINNLGV